MTTFDTGRASPKYFQQKYSSSNVISRRLLAGFFGTLGRAVAVAGPLCRVLEVGCGEGVTTRHLARQLPRAELQACDINSERVAAARARNPGVPILEDSIYQLPHASGSFDLVLALEVLEHLDDPRRALLELCRVSRRWVVCSVPREPLWRVLNLLRLTHVSQFGNTPGHINHWSARGFARFAGEALDVRERFSPIPWTIIVGEVRR